MAFLKIFKRLLTGDPEVASAQESSSDNSISWQNIELPSRYHHDLAEQFHMIILPGYLATGLRPPEDLAAVMIRIDNPSADFETLAHPEGWDGILTANFFDIESTRSEEEMAQSLGYRQILEEAPSIVRFLRRHQDTFVVIHCHAGISRSAAIALFLAKLRADSNAYNFILDHSGLWQPNPWVFKALQKFENI